MSDRLRFVHLEGMLTHDQLHEAFHQHWRQGLWGDKRSFNIYLMPVETRRQCLAFMAQQPHDGPVVAYPCPTDKLEPGWLLVGWHQNVPEPSVSK